MPDHFPLIEVSGSPYEMGYQHGAQAADLVKKYLTWIEKLTEMSRDILCRNAMVFLPLIKALSPDLVEEIEGLADGANISFEESVLCQVRAEASRKPDGGCTAFALTRTATDNGKTLAGQNQDLEPEYADIAILLRVKPDGNKPRALMFTFAGQLGYSGMNQYGVAHFANALYDFQWQFGLPHYPLKRILLEQPNIDACISLLTQHRTCSAANKVICDGHGQIRDVEIHPTGIALFNDESPDHLLHANHYLTPEFVNYESYSLKDSTSRLSRMRSLVKQNWGQISVETMKEILADHLGDPAGICRHGAVGMHSISGYIAEPSVGLLHVRCGHGCTGSWKTYEV